MEKSSKKIRGKEYLSAVTSEILHMLNESELGIGNIEASDPSNIKSDDSLFVSVFLYRIWEDLGLKYKHIPAYPEKLEQYSFSGQILYYLITAHSKDHMIAIRTIANILRNIHTTRYLVRSIPDVEVRMDVNDKEDPFQVWNTLFPTTPYQLSILLNVTGSGFEY